MKTPISEGGGHPSLKSPNEGGGHAPVWALTPGGDGHAIKSPTMKWMKIPPVEVVIYFNLIGTLSVPCTIFITTANCLMFQERGGQPDNVTGALHHAGPGCCRACRRGSKGLTVTNMSPTA